MPEAQARDLRATQLFESAGRHFNRGQPAFFFALGHLGWFIGPVVLILTNTLVLVTMWRRQFAADADSALATGSSE